MINYLLILAEIFLFTSCATLSHISSEALNQLAPTGTLRVAINYGNPVLATKNKQTGDLDGITVDISREIGRRQGIPVELIGYPTVAKLMTGSKTDEWDVAFLAIDSLRRDDIAFTAPYMEVENTYLVPESSDKIGVSEMDRPGIRIAVEEKNAADLFLSKGLKHALLIRAPNETIAFNLLKAGSADALASSKQRLIFVSKTNPGYRVLEGYFTAIQHGIGVPKKNGAALMLMDELIEEMKASGFIKQSLEKNNLLGVVVAPPAIDTIR